MTPLHSVFLAILVPAAWWVSGFDSRLAGKGRAGAFVSRAVRCGLTWFLMVIFWALPGAINTLLETLALLATFALLWCNCLTEMAARGLNHLVDTEDKRAFDPNKTTHDLDTIAGLVKSGHTKQAIQLCQEMKASGDSSVFAMETLLEHLGVRSKNLPKLKPLTEAYLLRSRGHFNEAKRVLRSLLAKNPSDADAALMLMQLYAQDLHRPDKAEKTLQDLKKQPDIPPAQIESAERSLQEWGHERVKLTTPVLPKSIDELLARGNLGTVIDLLEQRTTAQPENFELWLKCAEVHAVYCDNLRRADEIVHLIESNSGFRAEQIQAARTKLQEWRTLARRES